MGLAFRFVSRMLSAWCRRWVFEEGIMGKLLTLEETCEILRCSPRTLQRHIVSGKLPRYKIGRRCLIEQTELEKFIKRNRAS